MKLLFYCAVAAYLIYIGFWLPLFVGAVAVLFTQWQQYKEHVPRTYRLDSSGLSAHPGFDSLAFKKQFLAWEEIIAFKIKTLDDKRGDLLLQVNLQGGIHLPSMPLNFSEVTESVLHEKLKHYLSGKENKFVWPLDESSTDSINSPQTDSLSWQEPKIPKTPEEWQTIGLLFAFTLAFVAQDWWKDQQLSAPSKVIGLIWIFSVFAYTCSQRRTCRVDEHGLSCRQRLHKEPLPWQQIKSIFIWQKTSGKFEMMVEDKRGKFMSLAFSHQQISEREMIALCKHYAPQAFILGSALFYLDNDSALKV
ncbi:MAG TPA: hypothetical protein VGB77_05145 [Abditibacteriaceae bacterium]